MHCGPHPGNRACHLPSRQEGLLCTGIFTRKLRSHADRSLVLPEMTAPPGWLHIPCLSVWALKRCQGLMTLISFTASLGRWHGAAAPLGTCVLPPPTTPAAGQLSATREWGYWRGPGCGVLSRDGEMVGRCRGGAPTKCTPSPVSAEGWAHFPCLASVVHGPGGSVADLDHTASWACKTGRAALNRLYYGGCRMVCRWSF